MNSFSKHLPRLTMSVPGLRQRCKDLSFAVKGCLRRGRKCQGCSEGVWRVKEGFLEERDLSRALKYTGRIRRCLGEYSR